MANISIKQVQENLITAANPGYIKIFSNLNDNGLLYYVDDSGVPLSIGGGKYDTNIIGSASSYSMDFSTSVGLNYYGVLDIPGSECLIELTEGSIEDGKIIIIKDEDGISSTKNIIIQSDDWSTGVTIDGATNSVISTDYGSVSLLRRDGNWFSISSGGAGGAGSSGTSGVSGSSGTSGANGSSGTSGVGGSSGTSGVDGSGSSGTSGISGSSGTSGVDGSFLGSSGTSGANGSSGTSGANGSSGTSGANGSSGTSGVDGSGSSGTSGISGSSGTSGANGSSGTSGVDGSGSSGTSGISGSSGTSGVDGSSGTSGANGLTNANNIVESFSLPTPGSNQCYYLKVCYNAATLQWGLSYSVAP